MLAMCEMSFPGDSQDSNNQDSISEFTLENDKTEAQTGVVTVWSHGACLWGHRVGA